MENITELSALKEFTFKLRKSYDTGRNYEAADQILKSLWERTIDPENPSLSIGIKQDLKIFLELPAETSNALMADWKAEAGRERRDNHTQAKRIARKLQKNKIKQSLAKNGFPKEAVEGLIFFAGTTLAEEAVAWSKQVLKNYSHAKKITSKQAYPELVSLLQQVRKGGDPQKIKERLKKMSFGIPDDYHAKNNMQQIIGGAIFIFTASGMGSLQLLKPSQPK